MPRGGFRPGAGRKPRAVVLGMDGSRLPQAPAPPAAGSSDGLPTPPAKMPRAQQRFWAEWAPLAVANQTLTDSTSPGLVLACELAVMHQELGKRIRKVGAGSDAAQRLIKNYAQLSQRLDALLARFKLTAFGKPESRRPVKAAANPWAQAAGS